MSQVLTVPTHFNDIGELSEGFLDRVEQDTLILYGPVAYEEGVEIEFELALSDGSTALEGVGCVRAAVDGGEDRMPETRYDVVLEDLRFDGRSEVVFERLVIARQAVSDRPPEEPEEEDAPVTGEIDEAPAAEDLEVEAVDASADVVSVAPDELDSLEDSEHETVPPDEDEDEPPTVVAAVDAEAMLAEAEAEAGNEAETELEPEMSSEPEVETESISEPAARSEPAPAFEQALGADNLIDEVVATAAATEIEFVSQAEPESELASQIETGTEPPAPHDSMYAFEHGIASEPRVGMPVPMPSMAAPPESPPAPPTLRLAEPPDGLTRPSLPQPEDSLLTMEGEISDVHTTGLFAYENGLPIPSRPPLPDPNRAKRVAPVEAANDVDVEDAEPPEGLEDEYEEVRLSDFAEAVEEG
jgi:hypothetical protein